VKLFCPWSDLRPHKYRVVLVSALSVVLPLSASASTTTATSTAVVAEPNPLKIEQATASTNDGNVPANAIDGLSNTRWSGLGPGAYITFDLGTTAAVSAMDIAWYGGNTRRSTFTVSGSTDNATWKSLYSGESSGTTASYENYDITNASVRYLRVTVAKNTQNAWASITDARVYGSSAGTTSSSYDNLVLADHPVAFWDLKRSSGTELDLSGNGNTGTYEGGVPVAATMPNGDQAADFNGSNQYLTVPSKGSMSVPMTGKLTWEGWIRPDVLQFPNSSTDYVDWMGKCAHYSPTCEWEARMYSATTSQNRPNRFSAYVFNPTAGLGSAADWQPSSGMVQADQWYHVVGEYTTSSQPSTCSTSQPGSINIWVNGVLWSQKSHNPTGCMSQYSVTPKANNSPVNIGTMALDKWFKGAIGKVAIYDYLLDQTQITKHYQTMTGRVPTGSCGNTCSF
jgi:hypothetical protein